MKKPTVVYLVSRAIRLCDNQALYNASQNALLNNQQFICLFNFYPDYPYANLRNMHFLLVGLVEMSEKLKKLNIPLIFYEGNIIDTLNDLNQKFDVKTVYTEHHVLKPIKQIHSLISEYFYSNKINFYKVNTACVVPVDEASPKLEYAAKTIRPKLTVKYGSYLNISYQITTFPQNLDIHSFDLNDLTNFFLRNKLPFMELSKLVPGEDAANVQLAQFITNGLNHYHLRNEFNAGGQSYLSAYLHYGMLSPLKMIRDVENSHHINAPLFIEEALIRRELAENYCHYCNDYDSIEGAWMWARNSLSLHKNDKREYLYTIEQFEHAQTHDDLWNKCQNMIIQDGYLHSYLRMYWAKMVLLWSETAESAIETLIYLNDTYMLDGRDPNGYTGIMWSVAAVHDRPWFDRPVIGLIRAMVKTGTLKKTKIKL